MTLWPFAGELRSRAWMTSQLGGGRKVDTVAPGAGLLGLLLVCRVGGWVGCWDFFPHHVTHQVEMGRVPSSFIQSL